METNWRSPGSIIGISSVVVALLTIAVGFYQWRKSEERQNVINSVDNTEGKESQISHETQQINNLDTEIESVNTKIAECKENIARAKSEMLITMQKQYDESLTEEERKKYQERYKNASEYYDENIKKWGELDTTLKRLNTEATR